MDMMLQENRAYDHYFGMLRGVRGFNDRYALFETLTMCLTSGNFDSDLALTLTHFSRDPSLQDCSVHPPPTPLSLLPDSAGLRICSPRASTRSTSQRTRPT